MKKLLLLIAFACLPCLAGCPPPKYLPILADLPTKVFDPMLWAFQKTESNFDTDTINRLGYAGILQEGQEMITEANRICKIEGIKKHFIYPMSALDSLQSVQIWYIVHAFHNPWYKHRGVAKRWNPLASERYYTKTKYAIIEALTNQMILKLFEDYQKQLLFYLDYSFIYFIFDTKLTIKKRKL